MYLQKGIVLGIYNEGAADNREFKLTQAGNKFNEDVHGKLEELLRM